MKRISILVFEDCTSIAMVGTMEIFRKASDIYQQVTGSENPFFEVELVSEKGRYVKTSNGYPVYCHKTIKEVSNTDLVVIPALEMDIDSKLQRNQAFIPWIQQQYAQGADLASICTGAFLLAATGLLKGREATTHWAAADKFRELFPEVELREENIITDQGRIHSSGGATSFLNLVLYLVEKYCGRQVAIATSKILLIDMDKVSQANYAIFSTQKYHQDESILKAQKIIESNYHKSITVDELAVEVSISKRNFIRRFKNATGNTPIRYIQRVKIEAAKKALETSSDRIQQIVYQIGYEDLSTFRKLFKKYTGLSPMEYRKKYNRMPDQEAVSVHH